MTTTRATYHHGDLAQALADAALKLIGELGVEACSLREVAKRAGVNHRAVYRHYPDKRALLAGVSQRGWELLLGRMRVSLVAESSKERMVGLACAYIEFAEDEPAYWALMSGPRLNEDNRFPALEEPIAASFGLLLAEIDRGRLSGAFPHATDTQKVGFLLWSTIHGMAIFRSQRRVPIRRDKLHKALGKLLDPLFRGLA